MKENLRRALRSKNATFINPYGMSYFLVGEFICYVLIMDIVEIFSRFPTQSDCIAYLEKMRWNNKPVCPYCKSSKQSPVQKERRYHCNSCNRSYSVTVGTIFHGTHLPVQKWFLAISLILHAKKGISSRQLARHLHINRNTAWRISMKIRQAVFESEQKELLQGIVEMDECYIGGKPRKEMMSGKNRKRGRGTGKTPVVGTRERGGKMRAKVFRRTHLNFKRLSMLVRDTVDLEKSVLVTDQAPFYNSMKKLLPHKSVNHSITYADGWIHTNSVESFWAILKRGIIGQFHKVSVKYLPEYLNEFTFRFNNRNNENIFDLTLKKGLGVA